MEMGDVEIVGATDIVICIEDVIAVEGKLQTLTVTILYAEVEKQTAADKEISRFIIMFEVQHSARIERRAIDLKLVVGVLEQTVSPVKVELKMGHAINHSFHVVIVIMFRVDVVAVVK